MLFSNNSTYNPLTYNWNMVSLRYCDGASFSGNVDQPIPTGEGSPVIYYRGRRIRDAALQTLVQQFGMSEATEVIINGGSAGGLAVYIHIDTWCDELKKASPNLKLCVGVPDSGWFLDYEVRTSRFGILYAKL